MTSEAGTYRWMAPELFRYEALSSCDYHRKLLRSLCSDDASSNSNADVANEDSTSKLVQERAVCDCPGVKKKKT
ncbi:hypothetical protein F2Q70_00003676 [Brassica cretica]|nr:hypothetical protein F2Q70_00003676 [Brassica cretica]KAH0858955.1 hypothetical protein HID58_087216 [Brassica napus]CAF1749925.1 unnamed protein product [Brassica napus]VDD31396.1 unnamed protein product [Brassica oleracea]